MVDKKVGNVQRLLEARAFFEQKKVDLEGDLQRFADAEIKRLLGPGGFTTTGQLRELYHRRDELDFLLGLIESALEKKGAGGE